MSVDLDAQFNALNIRHFGVNSAVEGLRDERYSVSLIITGKDSVIVSMDCPGYPNAKISSSNLQDPHNFEIKRARDLHAMFSVPRR